MAVTGRPTFRDLFDESPTPYIAHLPRMYQWYSYVTADGLYCPNGGGPDVVIETRDGGRAVRIAFLDVPPDSSVSEYRALCLGLDVLAHRAPSDAQVSVLVDHDDLAANVNNAVLAGDHLDRQLPERIVIPAGSEHHWWGIQARIAGFEEPCVARVDSRENPAYPLANTPNGYEHVNRRADCCAPPGSPEFEADFETDVSHLLPSRFEGRASD